MSERQNKAPALQWYPDKWLVDTKRLSRITKSFYFDLLMVVWTQFQTTCSIPNDDQYIAAELGCSVEEWQLAKAEILCEHRPLMEIQSNRLFSKGLWKEKEKQELRRRTLSENGKKGGRPKANENQKLFQTKAKKSLSSSFSFSSSSSFLKNKNTKHSGSAIAEPCEREEHATKPPRIKPPRPPLTTAQRALFDVFWAAYPLRKGKGQAERMWQKLEPDHDLVQAMIQALGEQQSERAQLQRANKFVPEWKHPATWLHARAWEDELASPRADDDPFDAWIEKHTAAGGAQ